MFDARRERHANAVQFSTDYGQKMREICEPKNPSGGSGVGVPVADDWDCVCDDDIWDRDNNDGGAFPRKLSSAEGTIFSTGTDFYTRHPGRLEGDPRAYHYLRSGRPEVDGVQENFYCRQMEEAEDVFEYSDAEDARYWPASSDDEEIRRPEVADILGMHLRGSNDLSMTSAKLGFPKIHSTDFTFGKNSGNKTTTVVSSSYTTACSAGLPPTTAPHPQRTGPLTELAVRQFGRLSEERAVLARQIVVKEMEDEARQVGEEDHDLPSVTHLSHVLLQW